VFPPSGVRDMSRLVHTVGNQLGSPFPLALFLIHERNVRGSVMRVLSEMERKRLAGRHKSDRQEHVRTGRAGETEDIDP